MGHIRGRAGSPGEGGVGVGRPLVDLTGRRFGRLIVIGRAYHDTDNGWYWECRCDCGKKHIASGETLRRGHTTSCGCYSKEVHSKKGRKRTVTQRDREAHQIHGGHDTRLYGIWCGLKDRCYRTKNSDFKYYGGRGIKVCDEWLHDFAKFREWA